MQAKKQSHALNTDDVPAGRQRLCHLDLSGGDSDQTANGYASRPFDRTITVHARDQRNMRYSGVWPTHASLVVQLSVSCPAFPIKHARSYKPCCCLNLLQHPLHKHEWHRNLSILLLDPVHIHSMRNTYSANWDTVLFDPYAAYTAS